MTLTNVEPKKRSTEEIRELFEKADADKSGELSRNEFLALYLAIIRQRIKGSPLVGSEGEMEHVFVDPPGQREW